MGLCIWGEVEVGQLVQADAPAAARLLAQLRHRLAVNYGTEPAVDVLYAKQLLAHLPYLEKYVADNLFGLAAVAKYAEGMVVHALRMAVHETVKGKLVTF